MASSKQPGVLGHSLDEVIAAMPVDSQARIAELAARLQAEVEGMKAPGSLARQS